MIAIIDYGIGGLGLYKMVRKDFPQLPVLYFSDSGEVPYGKLSKKLLRARIEKVFAFLRGKNVERIIVACHSASSVVLDSDKDVVGLRSQTVKAVTKRKPGSVGIIGGGRTIRSGYYRNQLGKKGIKTIQRIAQPLSILVERGEVEGDTVDIAVSKVVRPLASCDAILLACTHYPVLSNVIKKYSAAKLIDPIEELYESIYPLLDRNERGRSEFMTTGDTKLMAKAARLAFGVNILNPKKVLV